MSTDEIHSEVGMSDEQTIIPFEINDCALVGIATGRRAQSLREMRDILLDIHPGSIYYHFWGGLLRPYFVSVLNLLCPTRGYRSLRSF